MIYIENAGERLQPAEKPGTQNMINSLNFTTLGFGETAYHRIRRFVVVRPRNREGYAYCWYVLHPKLFCLFL